MSDEDDVVYMDFEEPHPFDKAPNSGSKDAERIKRDEDGEPLAIGFIPVLPPPEPVLTGDEIKRGISDKARSAANLKVEAGRTFQEIAEILELPDAATARRLVQSVLANIHPIEDLETMRMVMAARYEKQFSRSVAMAGADFLVDKETGQKLPNHERLKWHQQASNDLMMLATVTGAKAPAKVEVTPGEADYDTIVSALLERMGHEEVAEAEVIEFRQIEAEFPADVVDDDDEA